MDSSAQMPFAGGRKLGIRHCWFDAEEETRPLFVPYRTRRIVFVPVRCLLPVERLVSIVELISPSGILRSSGDGEALWRYDLLVCSGYFNGDGKNAKN